ncbi:unnamed protein product [Didymodactylos carnosus]|uniref:Galactose mutarotase n=1 Tax=Didymodactylos carnosus TaxID=1234261 RepID=A0A813U9S1_9BILA|nr:unnamed protein product [Didymodactylos carnosus]CAF3612559.1 unnamed protein product [Didymodactylos carnosus]
MVVKITESLFGVTKNENEVKKYTLTSPNGLEISLINYGATIQSIRQPDRNNQVAEITLGYDTLQGYVEDKSSFGCTVGRVTNRIKDGKFELDGKLYELEKTDGTKKHHLHGEDGYPGQVDVTVTYHLNDDNYLRIDYHATSTQATPINMTNHAYFNLAGHNSGTILNHHIEVNSNRYLATDDELIPTGTIASVDNTSFDLRTLTLLGERIGKVCDGYDIMYVVDGSGRRYFGKVLHRESGRAISTESTQNGLQLYTSNMLKQVTGHDGVVYDKYGALCLETQNYSDSVNNQVKR